VSGISVDITVPLDGFSVAARFDVSGAPIISIFGPSGAGKTTVLRAIAGLESRARGVIRMGDDTWLDTASGVRVPTHQRRVGYVFQEASLFPHLDVRGNLNYALSRVKVGEGRIAFDDAVDCLGVGALLSRPVTELSGGERQRVAMARALLSSPKLLLMDEPLASLDEASRAAVLPYIERLHRELSIPILYVSHNLREVARLAHTVVEVRGGKVVATGPTAKLLESMVLSPDGEAPFALLDVCITRHDPHYHLSEGASAFGRIWIPAARDDTGATIRIQIAARDVSLGLHHDPESSILNQLEMEVAGVEEFGPAQVLVRLIPPGIAEGPMLSALITKKSCDALGIMSGMKIFARVKGVQLIE
jgi:molybdate transport system ATP-binding protein